MIEPSQTEGLLALLASMKPIDDEFPDVDEGLPALDDGEI
jgi:hypothetical protein